MGDQAGGAGKQGNARQGRQREADIKHDGRDGAVDVDRQAATGGFGQGGLDGIKRVDMSAFDAVIGRELEQQVGARVAFAMLRVTEAGDAYLDLLRTADREAAREAGVLLGELGIDDTCTRVA